MIAQSAKIKVLIVDDSAIVRKLLSDCVASQPDMEVVGTAPDPFVAREKILSLAPDVLTLDIEMPRMDGLTFLKKVMQYRPMPVVIISSLAQHSCEVAMEALRSGAVEIVAKPSGPYSIGELKDVLPAKLRAAARSKLRAAHAPTETAARPAIPPPVHGRSFDPKTVLAIGASTGGTEAIYEVLTRMPADSPGVLITQHIPKLFSASFAERLNRSSAMEVREARDGDMFAPGLALVAPGDFHMVLRPAGDGFRVYLQSGPKVCYQRPAVDVMFASVAAAAKMNAVGALLTGMGFDGAQGLRAMREAGASTFAQDENSCVVYGMPKEAVRVGAVEQSLALSAIPSALIRAAEAKARQRK